MMSLTKTFSAKKTYLGLRILGMVDFGKGPSPVHKFKPGGTPTQTSLRSSTRKKNLAEIKQSLDMGR